MTMSPSDVTRSGMTNGEIDSNGHDGSVRTVAEIAAGALAAEQSHEDIGSFAAPDEPVEYGYDYALADERAVATLRRVLEAEGVELDPAFQPSLPSATQDVSQEAHDPYLVFGPASAAETEAEPSPIARRGRDLLTSVVEHLPEALRGVGRRSDPNH
jgi:hypothetical protein